MAQRLNGSTAQWLNGSRAKEIFIR